MHSGPRKTSHSKGFGDIAYRGLSSALHMIIEVAYINRNRGNQRAATRSMRRGFAFSDGFVSPVDLASRSHCWPNGPRPCPSSCSQTFHQSISYGSTPADGSQRIASVLITTRKPAPAAVPRHNASPPTISAMTVVTQCHVFPESLGHSNSNADAQSPSRWRVS